MTAIVFLQTEVNNRTSVQEQEALAGIDKDLRNEHGEGAIYIDPQQLNNLQYKEKIIADITKDSSHCPKVKFVIHGHSGLIKEDDTLAAVSERKCGAATSQQVIDFCNNLAISVLEKNQYVQSIDFVFMGCTMGGCGSDYHLSPPERERDISFTQYIGEEVVRKLCSRYPDSKVNMSFSGSPGIIQYPLPQANSDTFQNGADIYPITMDFYSTLADLSKNARPEIEKKVDNAWQKAMLQVRLTDKRIPVFPSPLMQKFSITLQSAHEYLNYILPNEDFLNNHFVNEPKVFQNLCDPEHVIHSSRSTSHTSQSTSHSSGRRAGENTRSINIENRTNSSYQR